MADISASKESFLQTEVGTLERVLLRHARDAFGSSELVKVHWKGLNYLSQPRFDEACREYDQFAELLERLGVSIEWMTGGDLGLDSIYVRDASIISDRGVILCAMGKGTRSLEPYAQGRVFERLGVPVHGQIERTGTIEGGDVTWLDYRTLAVGRGYRTNGSGIGQLRRLLPDVDILLSLIHI